MQQERPESANLLQGSCKCNPNANSNVMWARLPPKSNYCLSITCCTQSEKLCQNASAAYWSHPADSRQTTKQTNGINVPSLAEVRNI